MELHHSSEKEAPKKVTKLFFNILLGHENTTVVCVMMDILQLCANGWQVLSVIARGLMGPGRRTCERCCASRTSLIRINAYSYKHVSRRLRLNGLVKADAKLGRALDCGPDWFDNRSVANADPQS